MLMGKLSELKSVIKGEMVDDTTRGQYEKSRRRKILFMLISGLALIVISIAVLGIGGIMISPLQVLETFLYKYFPGSFPPPEQAYYEVVIYGYRIPRILLGIMTGACLAVAGASMQGILKNPLADPFTLGLSSAASCGAGIGIVLGPMLFGSFYTTTYEFLGHSVSFQWIFMVLVAFMFGLASAMIIIMLTGKRAVSHSTLILTGVVVGYIFSAILSYLKYISDEAALKDLTLWLLGGMWGASWDAVVIVLPIGLIGIILMWRTAVDLNALSSGDDVAKNLGVKVSAVRKRIMILSALVTSACMAFTGIIGFVGLMAPHMVRMLIGNDNRYLIPASAIFGALILVSCDAIARYVIRPSELPVGIIMYLVGGVFFMFLIRKMRGGYDI